MCGITGIVDFDRGNQAREILRKMTTTLEHRGPDGEGSYSEGCVHLGHRRLSIIDIESGQQPMSNEDGTIWITYNGEIYNFHELRKDLLEKGHQFKTSSDTEVIVHAYEEYGLQAIQSFRGMFAFALWDSRKQHLVVARDRLGKKPLYYYFNDGKFVFASEMKAILQDSSIKRELDIRSLGDYLTYGYVPFPKTIFKNIHKLPPAHLLVVTLGEQPIPPDFGNKESSSIHQSTNLTLSSCEYWDVNFHSNLSLSEDEWLYQLEEVLLQSIEMRLISEVPLGAFLSGGIDSSTIVALMSRLSNRPVKTFSIGFEDQNFSELKFASMIASRFQTDHHELIIRPDAVDALDKLSWQFDEPFADPSALPTYYVSKIAREHVTVILSGDGGDEGFAGYGRYNHYLKFDWVEKIPLSLRRCLFGGAASLLPHGFKGKGILQNLSEDSFRRFANVVTFATPTFLDQLLHDNTGAELNKTASQDKAKPVYDFLHHYFYKKPDIDTLSRLQYVDIKTYLAEDILTKVDRTSMFCSLETRAPLLDHKLMEFIATMPPTLRIKNGIQKYILKKLMAKYLPPTILERRKMGFDMPLSSWFRKDFSVLAKDILFSQESRQRNIFDLDSIDNLLSIHQKAGRDVSPNLWSLVFFEKWCQNWL